MRSFFLLLMACGVTPTEDLPATEDTPPTTSAADTQAWLAAGHYKSWTCEPAPTEKTGGDPAIHVHGINRVCVNSKLAATPSPGAAGSWPIGVAAVKEIYSGDTITKIYLETKIAEDSQGGQGWYFYEARTGAEATAEVGRAVCVGCHDDAGKETGAGDFVFSRAE